MVRSQRSQQPDARRRPSTIRFTQDSIQKNFKDGRSCLKLYDDIKNKGAAVSDIPAIRVAEKDELFYSSNNRRLYVFRALECDGIIDYISVKMIRYEDITKKGHKITTKNNGESVRVRDEENPLPHSIDEIKSAKKERKRRGKSGKDRHASRNPITTTRARYEVTSNKNCVTRTPHKAENMEPNFRPTHPPQKATATTPQYNSTRYSAAARPNMAEYGKPCFKQAGQSPEKWKYELTHHSATSDLHRSGCGNPSATKAIASTLLRRNTSEKKNWESTAAISRFDYMTPRQPKKAHEQNRHRLTISQDRYSFVDDLERWNTYHNRAHSPLSKDEDPESYWWKLVTGGCAAAILYYFLTRSETNLNENVSSSIIPDVPEVPQLPHSTLADTLLAGDRVHGDLSFPSTQPFEKSVDAAQTGILASMFSGSTTVLGYGFSLIRWTTKQVVFLLGKVIEITPFVLTKAGSLLKGVLGLTARVIFDAASVLFRVGFPSIRFIFSKAISLIPRVFSQVGSLSGKSLGLIPWIGGLFRATC